MNKIFEEPMIEVLSFEVLDRIGTDLDGWEAGVTTPKPSDVGDNMPGVDL